MGWTPSGPFMVPNIAVDQLPPQARNFYYPNRVPTRPRPTGFNVNPQQTKTVLGQVVRVIDGDTFDAAIAGFGTVSVRIAQIDAPEFTQEYGSDATAALIDLIGGRQVLLATYGAVSYGRLVARVKIGATDVGAVMIRAGHAWAWPGSESIPADPIYQRLERIARANHMGLWRGAHPLEPWLFRDVQP